MGWRDINMNRRKPPVRHAVIPVAEGQGRVDAVLRKVAMSALAAAEAQGAGLAPALLLPFLAGYVAGFARQQALRHSVDAEQEGESPMPALLDVLAAEAAPQLAEAIGNVHFSARQPGQSRRAALAAAGELADAGYLAGHLDAICETRRLIRAAAESFDTSRPAEAFLNASDIAADPMQTRQPTLSLRFDASEREIVRRAFGGGAQ